MSLACRALLTVQVCVGGPTFKTYLHKPTRTTLTTPRFLLSGGTVGLSGSAPDRQTVRNTDQQYKDQTDPNHVQYRIGALFG